MTDRHQHVDNWDATRKQANVDEPTNWELRRAFEHNHQETASAILDVKSQIASNHQIIVNEMARYLLKEVYEARERAHEERIRIESARVDRIEGERHEDRRHSKNAWWMGIGAIAAAVIGSVVLAYLTKGAVH